jgi:hypothetical protein
MCIRGLPCFEGIDEGLDLPFLVGLGMGERILHGLRDLQLALFVAAPEGVVEVADITVEGLGHTWAGGKSLLPESMVGKRSDKIKATDVIREFFQKHPKT